MQTDPHNDARLVRTIQELCKHPTEGTWFEFKRNNADPRVLGENASAVANAAALEQQPHGYLIWGVNDVTHQIVGTDFGVLDARKGGQGLEPWLARQLDPNPGLLFREVEIGGHRLSVIRIACSVHRPIQFEGVEYIRVGPHTKKLKDHAELARRLWRSFDEKPFEQHIATADLTADDAIALLDCDAYFRLVDERRPATAKKTLERLEEDRMVRASPGNRWDVTNLGGILLAQDLSRFDGLQRKRLRIIQYDGNNKTVAKKEPLQHRSRGYAVGFEDWLTLLNAMLPENEVLGSVFRKRIPMYPELALRELVANALVHQDFSIGGTGPMVEVYESRIEITSPGRSLVDVQRLLNSPPRSRNEWIADFMRRINICEERGSGIDKVVDRTEFFQLPAPLFEVPEENFRAVLFAHRPYRQMTRADRTRACDLHACLRHAQGEELTNPSLRQRFGLNDKDRSKVSRVIREAVEDGVIRPKDPDSNARANASYVPVWA